jgi:hypothetical protein
MTKRELIGALDELTDDAPVFICVNDAGLLDISGGEVVDDEESDPLRLWAVICSSARGGYTPLLRPSIFWSYPT